MINFRLGKIKKKSVFFQEFNFAYLPLRNLLILVQGFGDFAIFLSKGYLVLRVSCLLQQ